MLHAHPSHPPSFSSSTNILNVFLFVSFILHSLPIHPSSLDYLSCVLSSH
jgi:hypothetical protein